MSNVIAVINGTSTGASKEERVGHWAVELQLVNDRNEPDLRPAACKALAGEVAGMTHNQAAIEAVRQALSAMKRDGVTVTVVTTNDYLIGVLARHWKPSRNKGQIAEVKALLERHTVMFEKPV
ncbi:MAG: hypothetical protein AAF125_24090 [Chloroflexota bacterium]